MRDALAGKQGRWLGRWSGGDLELIAAAATPHLRRSRAASPPRAAAAAVQEDDDDGDDAYDALFDKLRENDDDDNETAPALEAAAAGAMTPLSRAARRDADAQAVIDRQLRALAARLRGGHAELRLRPRPTIAAAATTAATTSPGGGGSAGVVFQGRDLVDALFRSQVVLARADAVRVGDCLLALGEVRGRYDHRRRAAVSCVVSGAAQTRKAAVVGAAVV